MQEERSQHRNRAKAMALLRSRILDAREPEARTPSAPQDRRAQVGSGDRSQRIRTYNFPQGRVTDHRINLTLYKLDRVMEGEGLDEIIDALAAERQARLLAEQAEADDRPPAAIRARPDDRPARRLVQSAARRPPADLRARAAPPRLDRLWWLVTPGNPLKPTAGLAETAGARRCGARAGARSARRGHRLRGGDRLALHLLDARLAASPGAEGSASSGSWAPTTSRQFHRWRRWRDDRRSRADPGRRSAGLDFAGPVRAAPARR